jgi:hypothetical protein
LYVKHNSGAFPQTGGLFYSPLGLKKSVVNQKNKKEQKQ